MKLPNRWPLALALTVLSIFFGQLHDPWWRTISWSLAVTVATYSIGRVASISHVFGELLTTRPRTSYYVQVFACSAVVYFWFDKGREHRNLAWALAIVLAAGILLLPHRYPAPTPESCGVRTPVYPEDVDAWLAERESSYGPFAGDSDANVGSRCDSHVVWAAGWEQRRAPIVVLCVHGWSASPRESEPFPTALATALGAHLYKHRLVGHAMAPDLPRGSDALLDVATRPAMLIDVVVAWKVARTLGKRVVVLGCSTGAALLTWLIAQPWIADDEFANISAAIMISPAYALASPVYPIVKWSWRLLPHRFIVSLLHAAIGSSTYDWSVPPGPKQWERSEFWTCSYPTAALVNIISLYWQVEHAVDYRNIKCPLLVFANPNDGTVSFKEMQKRLRRERVPNAPSIEWVDMAHAGVRFQICCSGIIYELFLFYLPCYD